MRYVFEGSVERGETTESIEKDHAIA